MSRTVPEPAALLGGIEQPGFGQRTTLEKLRSSAIQSRSLAAVIRAETVHAKLMVDAVTMQERKVNMWQKQLARLNTQRNETTSPHLCPILTQEINNISARLKKAEARLEQARNAVVTRGPDIAARILHWQAIQQQDK